MICLISVSNIFAYHAILFQCIGYFCHHIFVGKHWVIPFIWIEIGIPKYNDISIIFSSRIYLSIEDLPSFFSCSHPLRLPPISMYTVLNIRLCLIFFSYKNVFNMSFHFEFLSQSCMKLMSWQTILKFMYAMLINDDLEMRLMPWLAMMIVT